MFKISFQPADALLFTGVDNNKVVSNSSRNIEKLAKSNFIKALCEAEEFSFLTSNTKRAFN